MAKNKGYTRRTEDGEASASVTVKETSSPERTGLLFGKKNYTFMLIGIGLIFLGLILMAGGHMPSPDVWDESLIYSPVRITVAPVVILAGLVMNVWAIFVRK